MAPNGATHAQMPVTTHMLSCLRQGPLSKQLHLMPCPHHAESLVGSSVVIFSGHQ